MLAKNTKRWLSMLLALVMILTAIPSPVLAAEEDTHDHAESTVIPEEIPEIVSPAKTENVIMIQESIDYILMNYLGTTSATLEEIQTIVAEMDEMTRMDLQFETLILEEDISFMELTEGEAQAIINANAVYINLNDVLLAYPMDFAFYSVVSTLDGGISLSDTLNTIKVSGGTVTATAKGGLTSKKTNTITITNDSGKKGTLSFDYTVSKASSYNIAGITNQTSGTVSVLLDAGETVTVSVTSNSGFSNLTVTLTMSNFQLVEAAASSKVTFQYDNTLGSVTVAGAAVENNGVVDIESAGAAVVAKPVSGATFIGWLNTATNVLLSTAASYTVEPTADMTVKAIFVTNTPWYLINYAGVNYLYDDLSAASAAAASKGGVVVLYNNATLPAGTHTIPAGITLLIPYNAANTLCTTKPTAPESSTYAKPTAYRTLTMAEGANLVVNGALSLSGSMHTATPYPGAPIGPVAFVNMASGSNITVNSGAKLYCWGFITGSGSVTVENGGTVYENFQVAGFKGGTNTTALAKAEHAVFPFTNYYIQSIEVPMTLKAGAVENGYMAVTVTLAGVNGAEVPFIGPNGMFNVTSGYIVKDFEEATDRLSIDVYGDIAMKNLSITMRLSVLGSTTIDSSKFRLPVSTGLTVRVKNGGKATIAQDLNILPGAQLYVEQGADITLAEGKSIVFYDETEWKSGYFAYGNTYYYPVMYAPGGTKTYTANELYKMKNVADFQLEDKGDAFIYIEGTLDASSGFIYTSQSGANITAAEGAKVILKAGTQTICYEAHMGGTDGKTIEYGQIPITPAQLKNADGSYTQSASIPYGEFTYSNGKWTGKCLDPHIEVEDAPVAPTCTATGLTAGSHCSACGEVFVAQEEIPALGHTEVIDEAVPATCTTAGKTEGKHCSVCGEVIVAQTEIPALGHTEVIDEAVPATCTTAGKTEGKHCSVCNEVIVAQETVPALGHTPGEAATCTGGQYCTVCGIELNAALDHAVVVDAAKAPTCTATGLTEGKHCSACGKTLVAQVTIPALGHTDAIDAAVPATCTTEGKTEGKHCSVCGEVIVAQETVPALGHTDAIDAAVPATCTTEGKTEGKHCSVCGEVIVAQETVPALGHTDAIDAAVPATCTTAGKTEGKHCSVCGEVIVAQETVPALGHTEVTDEGYAATCTTKGLTDGKHCSVCGEVIAAQTEIPELGHTEVTDEGYAATCTTKGLTDGKHCSVCGEVIVAQEEIPELGHKKAENNTCENCGETLVAVIDEETVYLPLAEALASGGYKTIQLLTFTDIAGSGVRLDSGVTLDLNGQTLHASDIDAIAPGAQIVDTVGTGLLAVQNAQFGENNPQLPVYHSEVGGYKFFTVNVELVAVTGKNGTPKYWFTIHADEAFKALAAEGAEILIQAQMTWDGQGAIYAYAEPAFTQMWAQSGAPYITVSVEGSADYDNFNLIPMITSAGVNASVKVQEQSTCAASSSNSGESEPEAHKTYCEDGKHQIFYYDAKLPTFNSAGYEAYEDCLLCDYNTYVPLPALEVPPVEDFETFIFKLMLLEMVAEEYVMENPGKDPIELVIKYIRTGVDRYNSGSWGIMAGYEDQAFADYVIAVEDLLNSEATSVDEMVCITSMKDIRTFYLPNGELADLGHIFGTMDITNHNKNSQNHADVGGWAGDLVDLLEFSAYGKVNGSLEDMVAEVRANYLGKTPADPGQSAMNQLDICGDLDVLYLMDQLYTQEYYTGLMSEIFAAYFTEELNMETRANYFLNTRLGGVTSRLGVRNAVYKAYTANRVVNTLEGTRDFGVNNLDDLRKAVCYAFADYVCQLAGDYHETIENPHYTIFSNTYDVLAPGITQEIKMAKSPEGEQMVYYVATVDITRDDVDVFVNYSNNDPTKWEMQRVLDQANAAQNKYGNPESEHYIPNYNVIVSTNASGFNMSTGEPGGLLVMNGKEWHPINSSGFFGITKDGQAVFGTTEDYNNIYRGQLRDGVAGFGATLIKDGKIIVKGGERASRTAIGITYTGKIVMMVFDGRQGVWSTGADMLEIAQVMLEAGCVHAINLDGGGSSTFVARQPGDEELSVVNSPSDGFQRSVATSIIAVSTAPSSTAFDHAVIESEANHITKNTSIQLTAKGLSATGNEAELPEDIRWEVSDERWATITQDGVLTGLRNGSVEIYLYSGDLLIGNKTIEIVVPDNIYFARASIDAVYGATVNLEVEAMFQGKPVMMNDSDVKLSLSNGKAGTLNGYQFTATSNENAGIKNLSIVATLVEDPSVSGVANVSLYKQGEATFDFDQATGGDRTLAWYRQVTNADQEDANTYIIVNPDEKMETKYTLAIDMTKIPIPKRLEDLTYMLPGSDVEGASAWTFLLQLAERISPLSNITAQVQFDKNLNVDVSEVVIVNEYFDLNSITVDPETNTVTMSLSWIKQGKPINAATANSTCIVSGIVLTPKDDASWGSNGRLNIINNGKISYEIYMRASSLVSFANKPENQAVYGLFPYVNPNDSYDSGAFFRDTYKTFQDSYVIIGSLKEGWVNEEGGFFYYENGKKLTGVQKIEGLYYDFGADGKNDGKTTYTGAFTENGKLYYAAFGELSTGFKTVGNDYYYFSETDFAAVSGKQTIGKLTYTFGEDGKLLIGAIEKTSKGDRYYWAGLRLDRKWINLPGGTGYVDKDGYIAYGNCPVLEDATAGITWMHFDETTGVLVGLCDGFLQYKGATYYCENGKWFYGAVEVDGGIIFCNNNGLVRKNGACYVSSSLDVTAGLETGYYWCDSNGYILANGFYTASGATYYIENYVRAKGFKKIGDYYYTFNTGSSKMFKDATVWVSGSNPYGFASGYYYFQADGTMYIPDPNGPKEIISEGGALYFTIDGVKQTNGLNELDGEYYYANSNGKLAVNTVVWISKFNDLMAPGSGYFAFDAEGKMVKTGFVTGGGATYYYEDLVRVKGFKKIGDDFYAFNNGSAKMFKDATTWVPSGNPYGIKSGSYYFQADGTMYVPDPNGPKAIISEGGALYFTIDGVKQTNGLNEMDGEYYYANSNGKLAVNAVVWISNFNDLMAPGSGYFAFGADGKLIKTGFVNGGGATYYYEDLVRVKGFKQIGEYYYAFNTGSAKMFKDATTWVPGNNPYGIKAGSYYFQADGTMYIPDPNGPKAIVSENGALYFTIDGVKQTNGLNELDGEYYYANSNGKLAVNTVVWISNFNDLMAPGSGYFAFGADGKLIKTGFVKGGDGATYYYQDLVRVKGFIKIGDDFYAFNTGSGKMFKNATTWVPGNNPYGIKAGSYYFDADGKMVIE